VQRYAPTAQSRFVDRVEPSFVVVGLLNLFHGGYMRNTPFGWCSGVAADLHTERSQQNGGVDDLPKDLPACVI